jgi:hypothetical protein
MAVWLVGGGDRLRGSGSAEVGDGLQTLVKLFRWANMQERRISGSLNVGVGGWRLGSELLAGRGRSGGGFAFTIWSWKRNRNLRNGAVYPGLQPRGLSDASAERSTA